MCPVLKLKVMDLLKKTYEIFGMVEQSCVFKAGSGFIRVDFRNGSLATSGVVPATFTTKDRAIQTVIENSEKFKNGVIKLGKSVKIGSIADVTQEKDPETPAPNNSNISNDITDYPDVTTGQMARGILSIDPYNISLSRLQKNDDIRSVAAELNVTFSNWK